MSRFNHAARVFMELTVGLQDGKRDIYSLLSLLESYNIETWDELYKRRPDQRGRMAYREAIITLWVTVEDYQPLCNTLGKWKGPTIEYTSIKPDLQENLIAPL